MRPMILMVDVDGVIVRQPDALGWSAHIEEDLGVPRAALHALFFQRHWGDIVHGRAALRERLAPVLLKIAPHVSCDRMIRYWFESDADLDEALLAQLAEVRASGVALHLATVQEHERASYLWNTLNLRDHFDDIHYTAQLGVSKPSQAFYEAVERRVRSPSSAIAFIDDNLVNVQAARMRGWNAAIWKPGSQLHALIPELSKEPG